MLDQVQVLSSPTPLSNRNMMKDNSYYIYNCKVYKNYLKNLWIQKKTLISQTSHKCPWRPEFIPEDRNLEFLVKRMTIIMVFNYFLILKSQMTYKNKNQTVDTERAEHHVELKSWHCDPVQPQNAGWKPQSCSRELSDYSIILQIFGSSSKNSQRCNWLQRSPGERETDWRVGEEADRHSNFCLDSNKRLSLIYRSDLQQPGPRITTAHKQKLASLQEHRRLVFPN